METIWVAIVVAVCTGVLGPGLVVYLQGFVARRAKAQDHEREDEIAAKLLARQDALTAKTDEVARVLAETTTATAEKLETIKEGQKEIHTLVNSNMTETKATVLRLSKRGLVMMLELVRRDGPPASPEQAAEIKQTRDMIDGLEIELAGRDQQAEKVATGNTDEATAPA